MSRVVLVTGAASGNGRAIAARFLAEGERVGAVDISGEALDAAWNDADGEVWPVVADVADDEQVRALVAGTVQRFGALDVLVNNAGITGGPDARRVHETPLADFDRVMAVNVRGAWLGCRYALPVMVEQGSGVIVNIASVAGTVAFPGRAAYSVSKGAVIQLTRSIAVDYAAAGIRCNALCPGMIHTAMTDWRLSQPELRDQMLAHIPQKEIGCVDDVAGAVVFLAGPNARYFNGAAVVMDGGYTAL